MTNHTGHGHTNTPAARAACRKFMAAHNGMDQVTYRVAQREQELDDAYTIETPAGKVRVGSVVLIDVWGEPRGQRYTITNVYDDIKRGYPGVDARDAGAGRDCWAYANQVVKVIKF